MQRRTYENAKVKACGHKFHGQNEPRTNCYSCWEAYFTHQTGVLEGAKSIVAAFGDGQLRKVRGSKFSKYFHQFVIAQEPKAEVASA